MNAAIINVIEASALAQWRQRIVTAAASGTPVNLTTVTLTSLTSSDGIATATFTAHGLAVGDKVTISGANESAYNVTAEILSVPTADTFTFAVAKKIVTAATGTITAKADLFYRTARFLGNKAARTANTGNVFLGLTSTNDAQPTAIATGAVLTLEAPTGAKLNLADLWIDVATNADGVVIWWC